MPLSRRRSAAKYSGPGVAAAGSGVPGSAVAGMRLSFCVNTMPLGPGSSGVAPSRNCSACNARVPPRSCAVPPPARMRPSKNRPVPAARSRRPPALPTVCACNVSPPPSALLPVGRSNTALPPDRSSCAPLATAMAPLSLLSVMWPPSRTRPLRGWRRPLAVGFRAACGSSRAMPDTSRWLSAPNHTTLPGTAWARPRSTAGAADRPASAEVSAETLMSPPLAWMPPRIATWPRPPTRTVAPGSSDNCAPWSRRTCPLAPLRLGSPATRPRKSPPRSAKSVAGR
ncbi:hypothetical protein NB717_003501 [Xanthomonas sacchari]|nr:hypothetical protein [Xanthomonas sacchari]MCW0466185.1 hypothetical protein [Xanthomonas sacchari]